MDSSFAFNRKKEKRIKIYSAVFYAFAKNKNKNKKRTLMIKTQLHIFLYHIFNISSFARLPQLISDIEEFCKMLEVVVWNFDLTKDVIDKMV